MKRLTLLASVALTASMSVAAFSAQFVVPTESTGMSPTNWTKTLSVAKFDTSLGTLTGVSVTLTSGLEGFVKYENLNAESQDIKLNVSGNVKLTWPVAFAQSTLQQNHTWNHTAVNEAPGDGLMDWKVQGIENKTTINPASVSQMVSFDQTSLVLNQFKMDPNNPNDKVNFIAASAFKSLTDSSGAVASWYETKAHATIDVVYTFEAVPEPGSMLALATGLIGVFGLLRRK